MSENVTNFITPPFVCTIIVNRVLSWFDRFPASYNCLNKNVRKLISLRVPCTSVTNRVVSWFDHFTPYYYCKRKNVRKLISPRVLFTSNTNRVLSWFNRFTAFYNCMKENVTKLKSARVLCTSVTKRVLSWFDRFFASYKCMNKNSRNSYLREFSQVSQIVFLADLTVLQLITTRVISPRVLCTNVTNRVLSLIWPFYKYNCMNKKCHKIHISTSCVQHKSIWPFYGLLLLYEKKCFISPSSVHNYHKSCC